MDITWGVSIDLVSNKGNVFPVDPMVVWENVKVKNIRDTITRGKLSDIEYNGEEFNQIPYKCFLIHN